MVMRADDEIFAGMRRGDFERQATNSVFLLGNKIFRLDGCSTGVDSETGALWFEIVGEELTSGGWKSSRVRINKKEDVPPLDFSFPETGYFNYKLGAVYLVRHSSRQWRVGYNAQVITLIDNFVKEREMRSIPIEDGITYPPAMIKQIFNRKYFSLGKSVALLKNKSRVGCAINKYICVGVSCEYDKPVIYYKGKVVGYIEDNNYVLFEDAEYVSKVFPAKVSIREET